MRLLVIGTMNTDLATASRMVVERGVRLTHCHTADDALGALRRGQGADLVLVDIHHDVAGFIRHLREERICTPVVACGSSASPEQAAQAVQDGAEDYLPLPPEPDLIAAILEAAGRTDQTLVYQDPAMKAVVEMARKVAASDASILLTGESGTGKEKIARLVHQNSPRAHKPFVAVNSAAIPEHLLESELFGHEKGAFTGAVARRTGKFEEAEGGTLLLDEITEMHPRLQAKLLRALQERQIDRLGGKHPVPVNIRIVATSNRDMREAVRAGDFREDLYFRLNVLALHVPPLRERPLDILALARYFVQKYARLNHIPERPLAPQAEAMLTAFPWPGNVRELENMMHRAILLNQGDMICVDGILGETLEKNRAGGQSPALVGQTVADVEKRLILNTLDHCLGNRTHAAQILGISIRTLRNKLHLYAAQDKTPPLKVGHG